MPSADFALINAQLVTVAPGRHPAATGPLGVIDGGALAAEHGEIVWVGPAAELQSQIQLVPESPVIDAQGRAVLPGFIDPHTHPIFAGERVGDFYRRALGERYAEQLQSGGLMATVRATRAASEDELLELGCRRAETFLRNGVTTIEGKTGYGLTWEDERKSLRVLARLQDVTPLRVVPAFLGAHLVPADFPGSPDDYVNEVIAWLSDARSLAEIADVWCDEGAFDVDQCRRILQAARQLGFALTAHTNELGPGGGARLAAALGALSVDHVVYLSDEDISALAASRTVAVLLPATTLFLTSDEYAPARRLLEAGVRVALGTDFNPGTSHTQSTQLVLSLAVLKLHMTAEEAIVAATRHAAAAIGMEERVGALEPGKAADLSVFSVDDYRAIPYHLGANLVDTVVVGGHVVVENGQIIA